MRRLASIIVFVALILFAGSVGAHGIYGHMHVTGWAVENMPDGELKDFLSEPEVFEALLYGAAYADSGYWIRSGSYQDRARAFAEYNHWPPFVYGAIQWLRANDPPPWDSLDSRKRAAFVMGIAAHGLQDEVFDSLFLYQIAEHDDAGQDEADPGTDGFLFLDDHVRMRPRTYLPEDMLIDLYSELDEDVDRETIAQATNAMSIYLDEDIGRNIGEGLGEEHADTIPWARTHYLDPNIPGSLRAEITPTRHYLDAVWKRLHGEWRADELVIHTYPAFPRRLLVHDHTSPDSWVTFIFGRGVKYSSGTGALTDANGESVPFERDDTRWGGNGSWTRLASLKPIVDLEPGAYYTAALDGDIDMIGDETAGGRYDVEFQVACTEASSEECPDLDIEPPTIDDPDAPDIGGDAGMADAGSNVSNGEDASLDVVSAAPQASSDDGCSTSGSQPAPLAAAVSALLFIWLRRRPRPN